MFFVNDTQDLRHIFIRKHLAKETASIAIILASIDFEWTLRRAILALGRSSTKEIRHKLEATRGGYEDYKRLWKDEAQPRVGVGIDNVVGNWSKLHGKGSASEARGRIVHGASVPISVERARFHVENLISASRALEAFTIQSEGKSLFQRIVRIKSR